MTAARILAIGGIVSAAVSAFGGFLDVPYGLGVSGSIMLLANIGALVWKDRK
jgi:hypothetical protein